MKTLLIPIDFSGTSENVLRYAADFSKEVAVERIILLNNYYVSQFEELLPSADFVQLSADDIQEKRQNVEERIKAIGHKLAKKCGSSIKIETAVIELPLLRAIHQITDQEQPYMLMIGSDKILDESYIGEQVIEITKTSGIPVFIVPAHVKYQKISHALVPCDFKAVSRLSILEELPNSAHWQHPELMLLNVANGQNRQTENEKQIAILKELLKSYQYQVYYSEDRDTVHGILGFAQKHDVQLIIALPGKYSFFYNLTHHSITDALTLNAYHPVLILK